MQDLTAPEWIARCSSRLQEQWPRLPRVDTDHMASALWADARWREMEPEAAALAWLRQGVLAAA